MIAFPSGARVWLASDHTDMRKGFGSLALLVQESLKRDPHVGDLYVFRGRRGDLIKLIWHDGDGACLFTKRLERGRFLWPSVADGAVTISAAQLTYLLSVIDWRTPQKTRRAAAVYSVIETCKLNDVDPRAWLAYVLEKLPDYPAKRVGDLLPWTGRPTPGYHVTLARMLEAA